MQLLTNDEICNSATSRPLYTNRLPMQKIAEFIPWWPFSTALILASIIALLLRAILAYEPDAARSLKEILFHHNRQFVLSYIRSLGIFLDKTRFILFPFEKFPEKRRNYLHLYGIFCSIAIFYTVVFYFISWAAGGGEVIGSQSLITHNYKFGERILIAVSFVGILLFGFRSVINPVSFEHRLIERLPGVSNRVQIKAALAATSWATMLFVFYHSTDRNILPQIHGFQIHDIKIFISLSMSTIAATIIALDKKPLIPFSIIITAAFCQHFGVPIAIVIPAAVAIATLEVGFRPLIASVIIVPIGMSTYYIFGTNGTDKSILYLSALALFPIYYSVVITRCRYFRPTIAALVTLAMFVPAFVPVVFTSSQINDLLGYSIIVLWVAIPLINAFWDAFSWFASWSLLQHLRTSLDRRLEVPEIGNQSELRRKPINILRPSFFILIVIGHVIIDFGLSLLFLFFVFSTTIAAIMIANDFAEALRPQYVVDTEALVASFIQNPMSGDGFWVTMIVVSTLLPTVAHFLFALGSLATAATSPRALRNALNILKEEISSQEKNERDQALFRITVYSGTFFFAILFILFGLYFLLDTLFGWNTPLAVFGEIERLIGEAMGG